MRLCPSCGRAAYGSGDTCMVCGASLDSPKQEPAQQVEKIITGELNALPATTSDTLNNAVPPAIQGQIISESAVPAVPAALNVEEAPESATVPNPSANIAAGPVLPGQPVDDPFFDIEVEDNSPEASTAPELPGETKIELDFDDMPSATPAPIAVQTPVPAPIPAPTIPKQDPIQAVQPASEVSPSPPPIADELEAVDDLWPKQPTRPPAMDDDLSFLADQELENPNFDEAAKNIPDISVAEAAAPDDALAGLWDDLNIESTTPTGKAPLADSPSPLSPPPPTPPAPAGVERVLDSLGAEFSSHSLSQDYAQDDILSPFSEANSDEQKPTPLNDILENDFTPTSEPSDEAGDAVQTPISFDESFTPEPASAEKGKEKPSVPPEFQSSKTNNSIDGWKKKTNPLGSLPARPAAQNNSEIAKLTSSQMARELANMAAEFEINGNMVSALKLWRAAVLLNPLFPEAVEALKKFV